MFLGGRMFFGVIVQIPVSWYEETTMQLDKKTITLIVSVLLNVAGGFGVLPPVYSAAPAPCAPAAQ
jgi:hypothetical protein